MNEINTTKKLRPSTSPPIRRRRRHKLAKAAHASANSDFPFKHGR